MISADHQQGLVNLSTNISTKQTITSRHKSMKNIKKATTYYVENPGPGLNGTGTKMWQS
jgi:hypothetical protein